MEDYIGKICPVCKKEIKSGDSVKVCPGCGVPYHEACWKENNGCATPGCSEQHQHESRMTNQEYVCAKCGNVLLDGQDFCPKCGTPRDTPKIKLCSKCGAKLAEGQEFCPRCGQKIDKSASDSTADKIGRSNIVAKKKNKLPLVIGILVALVLFVVMVSSAIGQSEKDFNKMFGDIADESWCEISDDGSYMKIDSDPYDMEDYYEEAAYDELQTINNKLGFSDALFSKMSETCALDGRQTESNDKVTVSWKYHPDSGMEVTYEWK